MCIGSGLAPTLSSGWGLTEKDKFAPDKLQETKVWGRISLLAFYLSYFRWRYLIEIVVRK